MTSPGKYEEQRDGWITAIRIVKTVLNDDDAHYEVTSPHVLDALAKLLIAALRVNGTFATHLSEEQIADLRERAAGHQEAINGYVRGWLDSQMARVMLDDFGDAEP